MKEKRVGDPPSQFQFGGRRYDVLERLSPAGVYKVIDPRGSPEGVLRTVHVLRDRDDQRLEALRAVSRGNRNVPQIIEVHRSGGRMHLIADWVQGVPLDRFLKDLRRHRSSLGLARAVGLYKGLVHGIGHLHNKGFVHGDLKPENLIFCRDPERLVVIDFGCSWRVQEAHRRPWRGGRSVNYAAPELHDDKAFIDRRSDQFSASVIFYEMLTQRLPYGELGGLAGSASNRNEFEGKLVRPSQLRSDRARFAESIWRVVDDVAARGLEFDPDRRYPNLGDWLSDLQEIRRRLERGSRLSGLNEVAAQGLDWLGRLVDRFRPRP